MAPAKLTILTALAAEADVLLRQNRKDNLPYTSGVPENTVNDINITVAQCGVGWENLFRGAAEYVKEAAVVGNIGISGGLSPRLRPGTILLVDQVIIFQENSVLTQKRYFPDKDILRFLEATFKNNRIAYERGLLFCSEYPLITVEEKQATFSKTAALAVDMESAGAAEAARRAEVPFFCIKVICDSATTALAPEILDAVDEKGNSRPARLLFSLMKKPWLIGQVWRMARDFSQAKVAINQLWSVLRDPMLGRVSQLSATRASHGNM